MRRLQSPTAWLLSLALLLALTITTAARADSHEAATEAEAEGGGHPILLYLPNRLFDLTDMVRARVRVGPGVQAGARVTRPISVNAGLYGSIWVGLHGPREDAGVALPLGFEGFSGVQVSAAKLGTDEPYYGAAEVGAGVQAAIVGVDLGVEPIELIDFVLGWLLIDIRDDDF